MDALREKRAREHLGQVVEKVPCTAARRCAELFANVNRKDAFAGRPIRPAKTCRSIQEGGLVQVPGRAAKRRPRFMAYDVHFHAGIQQAAQALSHAGKSGTCFMPGP